MDFFIRDPLLKRVRRMRKIEQLLIENTARKRKIFQESLALTKEYEQLKIEAKSLKKHGYVKGKA